MSKLSHKLATMPTKRVATLAEQFSRVFQDIGQRREYDNRTPNSYRGMMVDVVYPSSAFIRGWIDNGTAQDMDDKNQVFILFRGGRTIVKLSELDYRG